MNAEPVLMDQELCDCLLAIKKNDRNALSPFFTEHGSNVIETKRTFFFYRLGRTIPFDSSGNHAITKSVACIVIEPED